MPKIVAAGRCKKKKILWMRKNEANYTPWGSLSMKNLVNRLLGGGGDGKQMLTDKNLLIWTGRHQCVLGFEWMRLRLNCFLSAGGRASANWNILIKRWNACHLRDWRLAFLSFGCRDSRWPGAADAHRIRMCRTVPESLPRPRPRCVTSKWTRGAFTGPSQRTPSPRGFHSKSWWENLFCRCLDRTGLDLTYRRIIHRVLSLGKDLLSTKTENLFIKGKLRKVMERWQMKKQIFESRVTARSRTL